MSRRPLPDRRQCDRITFTHDGIEFHGTVGEYYDGRPGELFLEGGKAGTAVQALARDCAVAVSIALQFGAPISVLRNAMTRIDHERAAGPMGAFLTFIGDYKNG